MAGEKKLVSSIIDKLSVRGSKTGLLEVIEQCMDEQKYDDTLAVDEIADQVLAKQAKLSREDGESVQLRKAQKRMNDLAKATPDVRSDGRDDEDWQTDFVVHEGEDWKRVLNTIDMLQDRLVNADDK